MDKWRQQLEEIVTLHYGEPEKPGEHCSAAAEALFDYMENGLGLTEDSDTGCVDMYELYLFAKHLHGAYLLRGADDHQARS